MQSALYFAAILLVAIGIAHSYLGERYILSRLFKRGDLSKIFRDSEFTIRTLRFAWHLTSVAWWGFAAMLLLLANPPFRIGAIGLVIGCTFLIHFAMALIGSRGRHLSWPIFLAIGAIVVYATRS